MEKGNFNALILIIHNEFTVFENVWHSLKWGVCVILKLAYAVHFPFFIYLEFLHFQGQKIKQYTHTHTKFKMI